MSTPGTASNSEACGLCRRYGHRDDACPSNPANWPTPEPCHVGTTDSDDCPHDHPEPNAGDVPRADVDAILALFPMSDDGTGHIADCGFGDDGPACGCYDLPQRIARALAAHDAEVARAAAKEAEVRWMKVTVMRDGEAIREAAERAWDEGWTYAFDDHGPANGNPHRAARIARGGV